MRAPIRQTACRHVLARALILVTLAALGGCVDFGLDSRRFRCDGDPSICGEGWICGTDGFCTRDAPADAAAGDGMTSGELCGNGADDDDNGQTDCEDDACGAASCDDQSICTADTCMAGGACASEPLEGSCGTGCTCEPAGTPSEVACGDMIDNDQDGDIDCNDSDCPQCAGGLLCCQDGGCRATCR